MKKHISVWMLAARGTIFKVLGIFALMAAGQIGIFRWAFSQALGEREAKITQQALHPEYGTWEVPYPRLEKVLDWGTVNVTTVWIAAFLLVIAVLSTNGMAMSGNSRTRYTVQRLPIRERTFVIHTALYNFLVLIVFWGFSAAMSMVLCRMYYKAADPSAYGIQTTFLACYRNGLMHSLLPLEDISRYVRNLFMFVALALQSAGCGFWNRRGKKSLPIVFVSLAFALNFAASGIGTSSHDWLWILVGLLVSSWCSFNLLSYLGEGDQE